MDRAQLDEVLNGGIDIGASFGMPNKTSVGAYRVYETTVKDGRASLIFKSNIAPVVDDGVFKLGGRVQTLLPQRSAFNVPSPVLGADGLPLVIRSSR
jgi:hypothetical protein